MSLFEVGHQFKNSKTKTKKEDFDTHFKCEIISIQCFFLITYDLVVTVIMLRASCIFMFNCFTSKTD